MSAFKYPGLCLALVAALFSCRREPGTEASGPVPDTGAPISYCASAGAAQTKGLDEIDNSEDRGIIAQHFGIFALWNPAGTYFDEANNPAKAYLSNRNVAYTGRTDGRDYWSCNPAAYWPIDSWLNFFAYAPYQEHVQPYEDGDGNTLQPMLRFPSEDYTAGMPRASYCPNTDVTNQVDLCIGTPALDRSRADGTVPITFEHALTRIRIYVNVEGSKPATYQYRVTDLIISGVMGTNTFTFQDDATPFVWDAASPSEPYDGSYHLTYDRTQLTSAWVKFTDDLPPGATGLERYTWANQMDNGRLYMLPQTLTDAAELEVALSIYRDNGGGSYSLVSILPPLTSKLPTNVVWEPGKTISYLVRLGVTEAIIAEVEPLVTDWTDAGNTHTGTTIE